MLRKIDSAGLGTSDLGWLRSRFHFSFAEYRDPDNVSFGVLRVLNDDLVAPGRGFGTHPHNDFEILSYVVDGALTHADSMGNEHTLTRGEVQYMSAGKGVLHSEYNRGDTTLRFLQIWIFPDEKGHEPAYGDHRFPWEARRNQWLVIAAGPDGDAPVTVHQDVQPERGGARRRPGARLRRGPRPPGLPAADRGLVQRQRRGAGRARRARDRGRGRRGRGIDDVPRPRHRDGRQLTDVLRAAARRDPHLRQAAASTSGGSKTDVIVAISSRYRRLRGYRLQRRTNHQHQMWSRTMLQRRAHELVEPAPQ